MIEEKEREITRNILEALYDAWERQTDISLDPVQQQGRWNKTIFRTIVNRLEKRQGLIKSSATPCTFQITPNGIFYAEKTEIVPKDKVEWHEKIRHYILRELAGLRSAYGLGKGADFKSLALSVARNVSIKKSREIVGDLLLLVEIGDIERASTFCITVQGMSKYLFPEAGRQDTQLEARTPDSNAADYLIVWDPEVVTRDDYVFLVTALGDLVRSEGGLGVERLGHAWVGIPVAEGTLV